MFNLLWWKALRSSLRCWYLDENPNKLKAENQYGHAALEISTSLCRALPFRLPNYEDQHLCSFLTLTDNHKESYKACVHYQASTVGREQEIGGDSLHSQSAVLSFHWLAAQIQRIFRNGQVWLSGKELDSSQLFSTQTLRSLQWTTATVRPYHYQKHPELTVVLVREAA